MQKSINPKILQRLTDKLGIKEKTILEQISRLKRSYPSCTPNAVAQIYALKNSVTVQRYLAAEDLATLPHIETVKEKITVAVKTRKPKDTLKILISYDTSDHFIKGHIDEVNRAFTHKCYTSAYILLRKVIENLIVDILQKKYPPEKSKENKELYWDVQQKRFKDFSVILRKLFEKRHDFTPSRVKAIERLNGLALGFKEGANDKAHSWFHLVNGPGELEALDAPSMIALIRTIEG